MKLHETQFGARKNTASSRRHALHLAVNARPPRSPAAWDSHAEELSPLGLSNAPAKFGPLLTETPEGATADETPGENHLLTSRDVADLLHVPVSWVYGHTRQRCPDRIPGFRLGKYWRFYEADVHAWIQRQRAGMWGNA